MERDSFQVGDENILIVDDSLEILQILSETLSEYGYTVQSVVSGSMALTAAKSTPPDLILLDIYMPEIDGYQVCQQLKASEITCDIPIIFLSGLHDVLEKVKAFQIGGADYITKPFQFEELLARVKHQITIQRLSRQLKKQNQQLEREIAQRRKAELEAIAASQAKSNFLSNMSHELRTPLNAILGFAKLMSDDSLLNSEQLENIRIIHRSAKHLLELINDILELSKIESGIFSLDKTSFDLYSLLDSIAEIFQIKVEQKNIKLNFIVAPNVPQYIYTDEKKLRSCLTNLISNAITATAIQGSVTLRVNFTQDEIRGEGDKENVNLSISPHPTPLATTERQLLQRGEPWRSTGSGAVPQQWLPIPPSPHPPSSSSPHLLFEVEDTGCGIAPHELDKLFDAFVQAEAGKKSSEGTGLGLAITRKFVQMMGGEIKVESTVGKGSIFAFDIEVDIATYNQVTTQFEQKAIGLKPNQPRFQILVVDESEESRLLLLQLLRNIGFDVSVAENAQSSVEIWETTKPHLILMNTQMLAMDAIAATQLLRNLNQNHDDLSIIAIADSNFELNEDELKRAGFDDVIPKPISPEIVLQKIAVYLGISYIYDQAPVSGSTYGAMSYSNSNISETSLFEELMTMPRIWLLQLHQAANEVNEDLLRSIIEEIPESKASLFQSLMNLVKNFRLDIILKLTQEIIDL
ncbi:MAG: response regulator [Cyanobacteria bacterium P01_D01_bin.50]